MPPSSFLAAHEAAAHVVAARLAAAIPLLLSPHYFAIAGATDCWCDRFWRLFARSSLLQLLRAYCGVQNSESLLQP
jgi:hypothetical protein